MAGGGSKKKKKGGFSLLDYLSDYDRVSDLASLVITFLGGSIGLLFVLLCIIWFATLWV